MNDILNKSCVHCASIEVLCLSLWFSKAGVHHDFKHFNGALRDTNLFIFYSRHVVRTMYLTF